MEKDKYGIVYPFYVLAQSGAIDWRGPSDNDVIDGAEDMERAQELARIRFDDDADDMSRVLILQTVELCPVSAWAEENERRLYEDLREKHEPPVDIPSVDAAILEMDDDDLRLEINVTGQAIEGTTTAYDLDQAAHYVRRLIALLGEARGKPIHDVGTYVDPDDKSRTGRINRS